MTGGYKRIGAAAVLLALMAGQGVSAKQLPDEVCDKLAEEHAELRKSGVEQAMDADPVPAKSVLKPEELANIERYLFIEGEINFRCPGVRLPSLESPDSTQETRDGTQPEQKKVKAKKQPVNQKTDDPLKNYRSP